MVVFTVAGEVSLPGGKAEEHDKDDGITATREAEEEIGLDPSLVDVVAFLEPFLSQVSKVLTVPLCVILRGMHVHIKIWELCFVRTQSYI